MNDNFYEFKYLHHFLDSLTFGVNAVLRYLILDQEIELALTSKISSLCFLYQISHLWGSSISNNKQIEECE